MHVQLPASRSQSTAAKPLPRRLSPPVILDRLAVNGRAITVVRDDLLPAGTKQRAAAPYLAEMQIRGYDEFVYASPFSGFAQVAMAYSCLHLGLRCLLVCEADASGARRDLKPHPFTTLARSYGAEVELAPTLQEAERRAAGLAAEAPGRLKVPLGFDSPAFRRHLRRQLRTQWNRIRHELGGHPRRLWLPVGSGTLAKTFSEILPPSVQIRSVNVRVLPADDLRIRNVRELPRATMFDASMASHEPADKPAPVPSNVFYDAKLWPFIERYAEDGDLWWNVAR
ncbi:MAG TPA: pyridoxal-phosphate dependent enzyme [Bdellovibrionales bacterium]|nr:pyridoxal-phosphate dependent enzyme [Bdellovibrionales bacterium]